MRRVNICGLYKPDYSFAEAAKLGQRGGEYWTVNDWYSTAIIPSTPNQIWNIHRAPHVNAASPGRFKDWKKHYNKAANDGAKIIVIENIDGVNGQEFLDIDAITNAAPNCLGCSLSIMIAQAVIEKFNAIDVLGFKLTRKEYEYEYYSVFNAIAFARDMGVKFTAWPAGRESEWLAKVETVDWANIVETYTPYWLR